jgi:acetyltransferase EpsM
MKSRALGLIVLGGGGHARVVMDAARSLPQRWKLRGYVAPDRQVAEEKRLQVEWLGDDARLLASRRKSDRLVIGIGGVPVSPLRRQLAAQFGAAGFRFAAVVHRNTWVSPGATVAEGAVVLAGAQVNDAARIGEHCIVNTGAIVEHDVMLGAFAAVSPGAVIGGGASIGEGSFLGLGCRVRDHVRIGKDVVVGMGAVVVSDVPDGVIVVGVPARKREDRHE